MHAFIGYTLKTNRTSDLTFDLQKLYKEYSRNNNEDIARGLSEHEFMSQYTVALASSLASWDSHKQSLDYYKKLSWGGLEKSDAYKKLKNKDKQEIQKAIQNERYNRSGAKGTKCN